MNEKRMNRERERRDRDGHPASVASPHMAHGTMLNPNIVTTLSSIFFTNKYMVKKYSFNMDEFY